MKEANYKGAFDGIFNCIGGYYFTADNSFKDDIKKAPNLSFATKSYGASPIYGDST